MVPVSAFLSALDRADVTTYFATQLLRMLRQPADRRALPVLERWARSAANPQLRREAALSYINIAQSQAPAREARRLLWEPATTPLEQRVLADGRQALPIVWKALSEKSADDRRAAAALLGSFPDRNSIKPILAALDGSPGALTRDQLLFDLNMILLREGVTADREQRNTLATEHLRWLYDQLASRSTRSEISSAFLSREVIAVFPDGIATPFSVDLSPYPTKAVRSESPEEFRRWVSKHGCGVAFHAINVAEGIARVATTVYLPGGVVANQVWIGLYRLQGGRWVPLPTPPHMIVNGFFNGPNLRPTIRRDYGDDHPEKILAHDLAMERVRVDLAERASLEHEDSYWEIMKPRRALDASYVALLQPYRSSDAPSIRYTAEYEIARITGRIDLAFWIDALVQQFGTPLQAMAHDVIVREASREIDSGSRELSGNTREELIRAALAPVSVDHRLLPKSLPRSESISQVRGSSRFGVVSVVSGTAPLGMSGYSMLFERRASGWVFICVFNSWIS
jgi:hypothetical protein